MAVDTNVYAPEEFQFGLAPQTAWGTANTTDAQYRRFDLTNKPEVDWSDLIRAENKRAGYGIVPHFVDTYASETGTYPKFAIEGIVTSEILQFLLMGVMQDIVTESATTPYKRVHEWDEASRGLSGITPILFFSAGFYDPAADVKIRLKNCVFSDLELAADPGTQGGRLTFKGNLVSFGAADRNATLVPGSWVLPGTTFLAWDDIEAYTLGGSDLNLGSIKLSLTNGLTPLPPQAGQASGVRFASLVPKIELKAMYDAVTKGALALWLTNPAAGSAMVALALRWNAATADHMLSIDMNVIYDGQPPKDHAQAQGVMITLPLKGVNDGTNEAIEIGQANAVDMAWT